MRPMRWLVGAAIGGAIGAAIWVGVGHATGYEVGWIAWGVGALAGIGVRAADGEAEGFVPGAVGAVLAVLSILVAKYLVAFLLIGKVSEGAVARLVIDPDTMIAVSAREVADEYEARGVKLDWPPGHDVKDTPPARRYPPKVWAEAKRRWDALPPEQQQARIQAFREHVRAAVGRIDSEACREAFLASFGLYDLLWLVLAVGTAFKLGSSGGEKEPAPSPPSPETG